MVNNQLLDYIEAELKSGATRESITQSLKGVGWVDGDIDEAFRLLGTPISPQSSLLVSTDYHDAEAAPFQTRASAGAITPEEINRAVAAQMSVVKTDAENSLPVSETPSPHVEAPSAKPLLEPVVAAPLPSLSSSEMQAVPANGAHRGHPLVIAGVVLGSFLIVAGAVFGYMYWWQTGAPPRSDQVGIMMIGKLSQVTSVSYDATVEFTASFDSRLTGFGMPEDSDGLTPTQSNREKTEGSMAIQIRGREDWSNRAERKASMNWAFHIKGGGNPALALTFAAESRGVGDRAFIKLTDVPFLDFFGFDGLQDQWILFDQNVFLENIGDINRVERDELDRKDHQAEVERQNSITAFTSRNIIRFTGDAESTYVNNIPTYRYHFVVDADQIANAVIAVGEMNEGRQLSAEERAAFLKIMESIHFNTGQIWVGQEDLLPYRLMATASISDPKEHAFNGTLTIDVTAKDYNHPVEILIPLNAKPISEIFQAMVASSSSSRIFEGTSPLKNIEF